MAVSTCIPNS